MSFHWLRYTGGRKTGFSIWLYGGHVELGFRWSRKVFNATAGPYFVSARSNRQVDFETARYYWQELKAKVLG